MNDIKIKEPDFTEDLGSISNKDLTDLRIGNNTKNLNLISEFKNIQRIWLHSFNAKNIIKISPYIRNVKLLSLYGTKEFDLSFLEEFKDAEDIRLNWNTKATKLWDLHSNSELKNLTIIDFTHRK